MLRGNAFMCNFKIECFHDARTAILLKIDGNIIKFQNSNTKSTANWVLENGNHEITVIKDSFLNHWYWWLNIFNLIYVFMHLKNMSKGRLGYDDDFASCTVNFSITNDKDTSFTAELIRREYNKNGKQGDYFKWDNIRSRNIKIKSIKINDMEKSLIRRWRIAKGTPVLFYCILVYIILFIKILNKELVFDIQTLIVVLASAAYAIYTAISVFRKKNVKDNLKDSY
jgi:hypothetical protein